MELHDIDAALAEIQDALENEHAALETRVAEAMQARTYEVLAEVSPRITAIEGFRTRVAALHGDWQAAFAKKRRNGERLGRGLRTPQEAFYRPILEALVARGGRASLRDVLHDLEGSMGHLYTEHDKLPIPSDPLQLRWQNTAAWARNQMRRDGRISAESPIGVWEITDAGREWLREG